MRKILNNKGLTLIEVIVTLAVLGVVVTPLMSMFVTSSKINTESEKEYNSIQLAQKYMEEIKSMEVLNTDYPNGYPYDAEKKAFTKEINENGYDINVEIKKYGSKSGTVGATNPADLVTDFSTLKIKKSSVSWDNGGRFVNSGNGIVEIKLTNADKPNVKILLNTNSTITVSNERNDKVNLYIYNIVNDIKYDCKVVLKKGQVNTSYNNYTTEEDSISSAEKTSKNILYDIFITVQKDGKEIIDKIEGTTIFKYEPIK